LEGTTVAITQSEKCIRMEVFSEKKKFFLGGGLKIGWLGRKKGGLEEEKGREGNRDSAMTGKSALDCNRRGPADAQERKEKANLSKGKKPGASSVGKGGFEKNREPGQTQTGSKEPTEYSTSKSKQTLSFGGAGRRPNYEANMSPQKSPCMQLARWRNVRERWFLS